jgi:phage terminase large subunit-like protein
LWAQKGWLETTPGASIDRRFIAAALAEELSKPGVVGLAYDRWRIKDLMSELDTLGFSTEIAKAGDDGMITSRGGGVPLVEAGQGFRDMSPAVDEVECLLADRRLFHGGNPVLTMCASNAVLSKDPAGNRKFAKDKAVGRIDGVVALAMAAMLRKRMPAEDGISAAIMARGGLL